MSKFINHARDQISTTYVRNHERFTSESKLKVKQNIFTEINPDTQIEQTQVWT